MPSEKRVMTAFFRNSALTIVLSVVVFVPGCSSDTQNNIVLVIVDTLAAEHMSCYGYHRETSPNIDSLAAEGVLYARSQAQAPWTLPAMVTIYTGLTARSHGCIFREGFAWGLDPDMPILPEYLGDEGYATAAFVNIGYLGPMYGMDKGFDHFSMPEDAGHGRAAETVDETIAWMDSDGFEEPFLLVFHVFDPHLPYEPPEPYDTMYCSEGLDGHTEWKTDEEGNWYPEQRQHMVDLYDSEIRWTDSQIGRLLGELRARGLEDRTLVILTADHGEEFLEHGDWGHGPNLYQHAIHVPLVLSGPGVESGVDSSVVGQYDVLPTVLGYCGIPIPEHVEGTDLLAGMIPSNRPVPSSGVFVDNDSVQAAVRRGDKKVIWSRAGDRSEQYDLAADPGEQSPLAADSALLEEVLVYWATPCICSPTEYERREIQERKLRDLGYID